MNRSGAGGGFISQSHADRLSREGELRRQQQLDQHGHIGSAEEMNAMGFDSPPPSGNTNHPTSRTELDTYTDDANSAPPNDVFSSGDQAWPKERDFEATRKQSAEVEEPSELKKQATATYQRGTSHLLSGGNTAHMSHLWNSR